MTRPHLFTVVLLCLCASESHAQVPGATGPAIQAFVFGDAIFVASDDDSAAEGFRLGQMVVHGNATLSDRVVFFGEVSVTANSGGYALAMERAILRYDFEDRLKVSAGRYHTPISYWNTEFHHGLWLQGSVARPEAVRFGSRYIPVHFVGAMVEGNLHSVPFFYSVGVGNGRAADIAAAGDAGDVNDSRAFVASASVRPRSLFGFRVGAAVYADRISDGGGSTDELIVSGHVVWDRGRIRGSAEVIRVSHEPSDGGGPSVGSPAYYVHMGYRLAGPARDFTPYVRWEQTEIGANDPVFAGLVADYDAAVVGLRYDFDALAALKAEYRSEAFGAAARTNGFFLQASFAIPVSGGS